MQEFSITIWKFTPKSPDLNRVQAVVLLGKMKILLIVTSNKRLNTVGDILSLINLRLQSLNNSNKLKNQIYDNNKEHLFIYTK